MHQVLRIEDTSTIFCLPVSLVAIFGQLVMSVAATVAFLIFGFVPFFCMIAFQIVAGVLCICSVAMKNTHIILSVITLDIITLAANFVSLGYAIFGENFQYCYNNYYCYYIGQISSTLCFIMVSITIIAGLIQLHTLRKLFYYKQDILTVGYLPTTSVNQQQQVVWMAAPMTQAQAPAPIANINPSTAQQYFIPTQAVAPQMYPTIQQATVPTAPAATPSIAQQQPQPVLYAVFPQQQQQQQPQNQYQPSTNPEFQGVPTNVMTPPPRPPPPTY